MANNGEFTFPMRWRPGAAAHHKKVKVYPHEEFADCSGLAAALPFTASAAENLSYNYAEADYAKTDVEGIKADGWGVKGSYGFLPNFHAFGEYSRQEIDHTNLKVDR